MSNLCNENNFNVGLVVIMSIISLGGFICATINLKNSFTFKTDWSKLWKDIKTFLVILLLLSIGCGILSGIIWLIGWLIKLIVC